MSATEEQIQQDTERAERPVLLRTFAAELTPGDGRSIDVRIVPYGERATVADGFGGVARGIPYEEEWMPGVFDHQVRAANRVLANVEHEQGIAGVVARGIELRSGPDGFYGTFVALKTPAGDTALELVSEGCLGGVSLEARPKRGGSIRNAFGVVQRVKADLKAIAFCRTPAFAGAQVLAVREADDSDEIWDEELLPVDIDPETVERCRRIGIQLPQRYQAHPALEPDTPVEAGTSEAAPVDTDTATDTEES